MNVWIGTYWHFLESTMLIVGSTKYAYIPKLFVVYVLIVIFNDIFKDDEVLYYNLLWNH